MDPWVTTLVPWLRFSDQVRSWKLWSTNGRRGIAKKGACNRNHPSGEKVVCNHWWYPSPEVLPFQDVSGTCNHGYHLFNGMVASHPQCAEGSKEESSPAHFSDTGLIQWLSTFRHLGSSLIEGPKYQKNSRDSSALKSQSQEPHEHCIGFCLHRWS